MGLHGVDQQVRQPCDYESAAVQPGSQAPEKDEADWQAVTGCVPTQAAVLMQAANGGGGLMACCSRETGSRVPGALSEHFPRSNLTIDRSDRF